MPNGTFELELGTEPINYLDESGAWQPIDTTLVDDGSGTVSPRGASALVRIATTGADAGTTTLGHGDDAMTLRATGYGVANKHASQVTMDSAGRPQVYVSPIDDGAEFGATFSDPSGPNTISFTINAPKGAVATIEPSGAVAFSRDGIIVGRIGAPVLLSGTERSGVENTPVTVTIAPVAGPAEPEQATQTPAPTVHPVDPTASPAPTAPDETPSAAPASATAAPAAPSAPPASSPAPSPVPTGTPGPSGTPGAVPAPGPTPSASPAPAPAEAAVPDLEYELTYAIDPVFFADPATVFPLTLDPVICIVRGGNSSGTCTAITAPDSYDTYIGAGQAGTYPAGTGSMIRVGYDDNAVANDTGTNWGTMRGLVYVDPQDLELPDGAMIYRATLRLRQDINKGAGGSKIYARLVKKPGFAGDATWNAANALVETSLDSPAVDPCDAGGTDCYLALDVSSAVRASLGKSGIGWKGMYGFQVRYDTEGTTRKETTFYKSSSTTDPEIRRPELQIYYTTLNVGIDFDPALGDAYAPSTMTVGVPTILPVVVENKGSETSLDACVDVNDTDCYGVGYRFLDGKNRLVASDFTPFAGSSVSIGDKKGPIAVAVTPPSTPGQYTLRLDVTRRLGPNDGSRRYAYASDGADPDKYGARNKKILTTNYTRWTGTSAVERTEFSINVGTGDNASDPQTVAGGDGGQIGIDLATRNLTYAGDTGIGFADLLPVGLSYAYHSADATWCAGYQGILGACGWTTNWDERIIGGPNRTGFDYEYVDPSGQRYFVDTDAAGQLSSGAPVLLERERVTFADEVVQVGGLAVAVTTPVYAGQNAIRFDQGANKALGFPNAAGSIPLNPYPYVKLAAQSTAGVTRSGICFTIHNVSDPDIADADYCYTFGTGTSGWAIGADRKDATLTGGTTALDDGAWNRYTALLYDDIRASTAHTFGSMTDEFTVVDAKVMNGGSWAGKYLYLDAARFEPRETVYVDETEPSWTSGDATLSGTDVISGANALKVSAAGWGASPLCQSVGSTCWGASAGGTWLQPFASWWWKKSGGQTASVSFRFKDETWGTDMGWITYYAGPTPPADAPNPIQVAPVIPTEWTRVVRNFREDARQVLNIYTNKAKRDPADTTAPYDLIPAGPDPARMTGYRISAGDGQYLLIDRLAYSSIPDTADVSVTGAEDVFGHPAGDDVAQVWCADISVCTNLTYDFRATYADGSTRYFNEAGLLTRIGDLDGNRQDLIWTASTSTGTAGLAAYSLSRIIAAADGSEVNGTFADREIVVTRHTSGTPIRFDEVLGTQATAKATPGTGDVSSRAAVFGTVAGTAAIRQTGLGNTSTGPKKWLGVPFSPKDGSDVVIAGSFTTGSRTVGLSCPQGGKEVSATSTALSSFTLVAPAGASAVTCRAFLSTSSSSMTLSAGTLNYVPAYGDLTSVSPVRTGLPLSGQSVKPAGVSASFCPAATTTVANGCTGFAYTDTVKSHQLAQVTDPRYVTGSASYGYNFRTDITWDTSAGGALSSPTKVTDASTSAVLAKVNRWDNAPVGSLYRRPVFQNAVNVVNGRVQTHELSPDGSSRVDYASQACPDGVCSTLPDSDDVTLASLRLRVTEFDGLARTSMTTAYRCTGAAITDGTGTTICSAGKPIAASVTRTGSNAGAKIDNYANPLAAAGAAWEQSAEQYYASIRDSGGENPDLYRTETLYDGWHLPVMTRTPVLNQQATPYEAIVLDTPGLAGFWRMNISRSGGIPDASPNSWDGVPLGLTSSSSDSAILRNAAGTPSTLLDASSADSILLETVPAAITGSFTTEAWAKATGVSYQAILGSRSANYGFALKFDPGTSSTSRGIRINIGTTTAFLSNQTVPFPWETGRWYHVVASVNSPTKAVTVYVNGAPIGGYSWSGAGTPFLADATHALFLGQTGYAPTPEYLTGGLDEVAVYRGVLDSGTVRQHYAAGLGIVDVVAATAYDRERHPIYGGTQFVANGDFEDGTVGGWSGPASADAAVAHSGSYSGKIATTTAPGVRSMSTVAALVPGQTARVQFYTRLVAGSTGSYSVEYFDRVQGNWIVFAGAAGIDGPGSWAPHAWDVSVPMTGDGRIRITVSLPGGAVAEYRIDDVMVVTHWSRSTYNANGTLGIAEALPLSPTVPDATIKVTSAYTIATPGGIGSPILPAILPTGTTANDVTGSSSAPDEDVLVTTHYDAWGRVVGGVDPLGGPSARTAAGAAGPASVFAANQTDLGESWTPLGTRTTSTYDAIGNGLTTTGPDGALTTTTYDAFSRPTSVTYPDGTGSTTIYNGAGLATLTRTGNSPGSSVDGATTLTRYDADGRPNESHADCGGVTTGNETACPSGIDTVTRITYDAGGNAVVSRAYTGSGETGEARTTVAYFASTTDTTGDAPLALSAGSPSASRLPIAPTAGSAPACPGQTTLKCNSALVAGSAGGVTLPATDLAGRPLFAADAYGVLSRTFYDLDGRVVRTVAGFADGAATSADTNIVSDKLYALAGLTDTVVAPGTRRLTATGASLDTEIRFMQMTYDALGRAMMTRTFTSAGPVAEIKTEYRKDGTTARTAAEAPSNTAENDRIWTRPVYDAAGQVTRTISHDDRTGAFHYDQATFESALLPGETITPGWSTAASVLTIAGATASLDTPYDAVAPNSGSGRLRVANGAVAGRGVTWTVPGTFKNGSTYRLRGFVAANASATVDVYLGCTSAACRQQLTLPAGGSYALLDPSALLFQPTGDVTDPKVTVVITSPASTNIYLDDLVVYESSASGTAAAETQFNTVASETGYDRFGRVVASILPPGDPATESSMVTTNAYDGAGRTPVTVVNAHARYPSAIRATTGLAGYWPLDEAIAAATTSSVAAGAPLTRNGTVGYGVAGAVDEARTGVRLTGGATYTATAAQVATNTNFALEAWVRRDGNPSGSELAVWNGSVTSGFGIGIDAGGHAIGVTTSGGVLTTGASTAATVADGAWHHLVLSRGSSGSATLSLDGSPAGTVAAPAAAPGAGFVIGGVTSASYRFAGEVDEVAAYTADLSAATVTAHWRAGRVTDTTTSITTRTAFDRFGRGTDTWSVSPAAVPGTSAPLVRTSVTYDTAGRAVEHTADKGGLNARSRFAFDALGEMTDYCSAKNVADGSCPATGSFASADGAWHYTYDALGRQTVAKPPVATAAVKLNSSETVYDAGGRTTAICSRPAAASPTGCAAGTDVLRSLTPADTAHDKLGRIVASTTYLGTSGIAVATTTNTYNPDGSLQQTSATSSGVTLGGTDTIAYTYDALGRPTAIKRGPSGTQTALTDFTYVTGSVNGFGAVASRTDAGAATGTAFTYDWAGRLTTTDGPATGTGDRVTQAWRLDGLLASRLIPTTAPETQAVAYDALKRPTTITRSGSAASTGTLTRDYTRSGATRTDGRDLSTGSDLLYENTVTYGYDGLGRLVAETIGGVDERTYAYDLDSNRTSRTDGNVTTTYTYDRTDQLLTQAYQGGPATSFLYDAFGNLLSKRENSATAVTTMAYADGVHMTSLTPPSGGTSTLRYDALGRTATREAGGVTTTYAYAGTSEAIWQLTTGAAVQTSLLDASGSRLSLTTGTTTRWTLFDHLGSLAGLIGPSGSLDEAYRFDGYGQALRGTTQTGKDAGARNPFRFRGALNLGTDGEPLYEMGARFYAPSAGAWTSMDAYAGSAANPASLNRFLYVEGNPASLVDPTGHLAQRTLADGGGCIPARSNGYCGTGTTSGTAGPTNITTRDPRLDPCRVHSCEKTFDPPKAPSPTVPAWVRAEATDLHRDAARNVRQAVADELWLACNAAGATGWAEAAMGGCSAMVHDATGYYPSSETFHAFDGNAALVAGFGGVVVACVFTCGAIATAGAGLVGDLVAGGRTLLAGGGVTQACIAASCVSRGQSAVAFALEASGAVPAGSGAAYAGIATRLGAAADAESQAARLVCSFAGDTTVATPDGDRPIAELEPGDAVLARDPHTGATSVRRVDAVLVHEDAVTGTVTIDGEPVETTPEHPFAIEGRGFVPAGDLRSGDRVETASGNSGTVEAVSWDGGPARMWNLTVAVDHTFFVGEGRWWVHNECPNPWGSLGSPDHRMVVAQAAEDVQSRGLVAVPEYTVKVAGGGTRRVDIAAFDPTDLTFANPLEIHQVGVQTVGGLPVPRERAALEDLIRSLGLGADYTFWPYKVRGH